MISRGINKSTGRGFDAVFRENADERVRRFIDEEILVIHPDFRDDIYLVVRYLSGENLLDTDDPELNHATGLALARFTRLSVLNELGLKTRQHAIRIVSAALELRQEILQQVDTCRYPRPIRYTNPSPEKSDKPRPDLRVV